MARPEKQGLDYFPFDIDFFDDEKIEAISGEFGIKGEIAAIKLLCAVYRNGYFILWNEMLKMKLLKRLPGVSSELLEQIVSRLVKWGFFDETLFNSEKILTSRGIQTRYFQAIKRRKANENLPHLLVNVCNNSVNVDNNPTTNNIDANNNAQRKEEYSTKETSNSNELDKKKAAQTGKLATAKAAALTRREEFFNSLVPFTERFSKEIVRAFFDYWSEMNKSETKMKYELERTWNTERRLGTWERNESKFNKKDKSDESKESEVYIVKS